MERMRITGPTVWALGVALFTLIIYTITKAPTLSFWDCGEFIACSYTLGIPHPPGNPLYIMLGRIFTLLPVAGDISARVNMLSVVTGAAAAFFAFLVTFKLISWWFNREEFSGWKVAAAYIGALVGSMMFAFGRTHWSNSGEAEVYTPAMLVVILLLYLLLRWIERRDQPRSDIYLFIIVYLAFLSIGIHMTAFLFMPVIFLAVILFSPRLRKDYRFYITGFTLVLVTQSLDWFLIAVGLWLIVLVAATIATRSYVWAFSLIIVLAAIAGFSSQVFTPIRSAQNPVINQNNPSESYAAFKSFIERKQYGQESMLIRAMERRGQWINQFGNYPRMGFWGFFQQQYGLTGRAFAFPFVLGLLGIFEMIRRRTRIGLPFFVMILLGTVFLVWYMNFADGTRQDQLTGQGHLEVRDRDYFFTPGFILFGIAIGIGVAGLIETMRETMAGKTAALKVPVMTIVCALVIVSAAPVMANYHICDRSGNYSPYDFAYNLLSSCRENAILLNGGDNDTFPVWCLQEVYGVRTDVTAINLSLANLPWYVKQIQTTMGIPLNWSDEKINSLRHMRSEGTMIRIQDQVLERILVATKWERPVHFSLTIPESMLQYAGRSLQPNLMIRGMVYTLTREKPPGKINIDASLDLYLNTYQYRGLDDPDVYKDERTESLIGNYTTGLVLIADTLRSAALIDSAITVIKQAMKIIPNDYYAHNYLTQLYVETGRDSLIPEIIEIVSPEWRKQIYFIWGLTSRYNGQTEKAERIFKATLDSFPQYEDAFKEYGRLLMEQDRIEELKTVIAQWLDNNPGDAAMRQFLTQLQNRPQQLPPPPQPETAPQDS